MDKDAGLLDDFVGWVGGLIGGDDKPEAAQQQPAAAPAAPPPAVPAVQQPPAAVVPPVEPKPQPTPAQVAQDNLKQEFKNYFKSKKPFGIILAGDDDASFNVAMTRLENSIASIYPAAANIVWDGKNPGTSVADVDAAINLIGHIKEKGLQQARTTAQLESLAQGALMDANPVPKDTDGEETPLPVKFTIPAGAANPTQHPYNPQQTGALQNLLPTTEEPSAAIQEKLKEAEGDPPEEEGTVDERIVSLVKLITKNRPQK